MSTRDVFWLQGKLLSWWCVMQFHWERRGWAYVLMHESRHAQVIIAIPRRRIRMCGPVPRIQYEANLNADCGMDQHRRICQLPPMSTGAGTAVPSAPLAWNKDTEGMCYVFLPNYGQQMQPRTVESFVPRRWHPPKEFGEKL
ncbi:hypothetical protein C8R45DRAFT_946227 [Mycena sanguinolenta]|nr:hypothetical protein C8R45DRAFT_946227 [Mycena sanguinolenta]